MTTTSFSDKSLPLQKETPKEWVKCVLADFKTFLLDHASCERKAAALAMSFVAKYPNRTFLIEPMVSLAREEMEHFAQVYRLIGKQGMVYDSFDEKDTYVRSMLSQLRHGRDERFLDRLIVSGLIEARGWERFHMLSQELTEPSIKEFYQTLSKQELGHYKIFINMAHKYFSKEEVSKTIERLAHLESQAMLESPISARLH